MKQPIEYIKECLESVEESLIIEINARDGSVTRKLAEIPGSEVHAFEPLAESPIPNLPTNVQMNYCAITDKDSRMTMWRPTKGERYAYNTTTTYEGSMPPSVTYRHMVETIGELIGKQRPIVSVNPSLGYLAGKIIGLLMNDVMITREEIKGLMGNLLCVSSPPTGTIKLTEWIEQNSDRLGERYASELARRRDRTKEYGFT